MSELKLSITILVSFVIAVLGIGNVEQFQANIIDFSPAFFVLMAVVVFSELIVTGVFINAGVKLSYYTIIVFWLAVYVVVWFFDERPVEVHLIQALLLVLSSILSYDVGKRIYQFDKTLEGLSSSAYPNRARDMHLSQDLIAAEITRSRRYHHPLSILAVRIERPTGKGGWKELENLANDMIERFAIAKASQILSDLARGTDIVLSDKNGQFVILCPETNLSSVAILAERIALAVEDDIHVKINWGSAAFPDEALTFEDLLQTAKSRLSL